MLDNGFSTEAHFAVPYDGDYHKIYMETRRGAQRRGIEFDLSLDDFAAIVERAAGKCELSGVTFQRVKGLVKHERQPFMPSLDRIDSKAGYTAGNCRLLCIAANYAINTWGSWVLAELAMAMVPAPCVGGRSRLRLASGHSCKRVQCLGRAR